MKKAIDRADVCGLLACHAPPDEYDTESEEIARAVSKRDSPARISEICANVFSRAFSERIGADIFRGVGEEIASEIAGRGGSL